MAIVFSPALVLSPLVSDGINANNPVIGYRNLIQFGGVEADSELDGYPASNLSNPSTGEVWRSASTAAQEVTAVVDGEVDYVGIARHNFGSGGVSVAVDGRIEAEGAWANLIPETLVPDDRPSILRFEGRYLFEVRLRLDPSGTPPTAAVVYMGRLLTLQRRIYVGHAPITYNRRAQVTNGRSESGQFLGRIVTGQYAETAVSLQNLWPGWMRTEMIPFLMAARERPFFFAWRPGDYPRETGFAWLTNEPEPMNQRSNGMMQVDLQMRGIV